MMGVASYRVMKAGGGAVPLGLYAAQLCLNFAWSPLFFKVRFLMSLISMIAMLSVVEGVIFSSHTIIV